jgi:hypothetical protein
MEMTQNSGEEWIYPENHTDEVKVNGDRRSQSLIAIDPQL